MDTKEQIFIDAITNSKAKEITRKVISDMVASDKTHTIRKYLTSYGMMQLALYLQELAHRVHPQRPLRVSINANSDVNQKRTQDIQSGKYNPYQQSGRDEKKWQPRPKMPSLRMPGTRPKYKAEWPPTQYHTYTVTSGSNDPIFTVDSDVETPEQRRIAFANYLDSISNKYASPTAPDVANNVVSMKSEPEE